MPAAATRAQLAPLFSSSPVPPGSAVWDAPLSPWIRRPEALPGGLVALASEVELRWERNLVVPLQQTLLVSEADVDWFLGEVGKISGRRGPEGPDHGLASGSRLFSAALCRELAVRHGPARRLSLLEYRFTEVLKELQSLPMRPGGEGEEGPVLITDSFFCIELIRPTRISDLILMAEVPTWWSPFLPRLEDMRRIKETPAIEDGKVPLGARMEVTTKEEERESQRDGSMVTDRSVGSSPPPVNADDEPEKKRRKVAEQPREEARADGSGVRSTVKGDGPAPSIPTPVVAVEGSARVMSSENREEEHPGVQAGAPATGVGKTNEGTTVNPSVGAPPSSPPHPHSEARPVLIEKPNEPPVPGHVSGRERLGPVAKARPPSPTRPAGTSSTPVARTPHSPPVVPLRPSTKPSGSLSTPVTRFPNVSVNAPAPVSSMQTSPSTKSGARTPNVPPKVPPPSSTRPTGSPAAHGAPPSSTRPTGSPAAHGAPPSSTRPTGSPAAHGAPPSSTRPTGTPAAHGAPPSSTRPTGSPCCPWCPAVLYQADWLSCCLWCPAAFEQADGPPSSFLAPPSSSSRQSGLPPGDRTSHFPGKTPPPSSNKQSGPPPSPGVAAKAPHAITAALYETISRSKASPVVEQQGAAPAPSRGPASPNRRKRKKSHNRQRSQAWAERRKAEESLRTRQQAPAPSSSSAPSRRPEPRPERYDSWPPPRLSSAFARSEPSWIPPARPHAVPQSAPQRPSRYTYKSPTPPNGGPQLRIGSPGNFNDIAAPRLYSEPPRQSSAALRPKQELPPAPARVRSSQGGQPPGEIEVPCEFIPYKSKGRS
ncbi:hypothetical protein FOZ60_015770 [Perkinsus olseni]|uniref:Uncharacterized protein n=1 Tax=Perkinsus olseni TaxID=32597 RepID=A0A7J6P5A9_PEROL|nr:hypothetical protein FOZ60_015770 [Perkinsus olseni]